MQAPKFHFWTAIFGVLPVLIAAISFYPTTRNEFVDWDDTGFIVDNVHIRQMGWDQVHWMFTSFQMGPYQPLPWLTLALDYKLGGLNPAQFHVTSLLWHLANTLAFFAVARRLLNTGGTNERSSRVELGACIAAIVFAAHPLRVESVVWASERRDVVSGFFFLLSLWAYLKAIGGPIANRGSLSWMLAALLLFALSLCSKATGMCLPLVLIILDFHPLRRFRESASVFRDVDARRIWLEKIPFCVLSIVCAAAALFGQLRAGAMTSIASHGWVDRLAMAGYASVFYVVKTVLPIRLSPLYEVPTNFRPWQLQFILAAVSFLVLTLAAFRVRCRWPGVLAAWLSYLVMLAPVSGIAQAGMQIAADRYTYIPCLSFAILAGAIYVAWDSSRSLRTGNSILPGLVTVLVLGALLAPLTWRQTKVWRDTRSLWTHALKVNPQSSMAHNNAAMALLREQRVMEAYRLLEIALRLRPDYHDAHSNIAVALRRMGRPYEAMDHYRLAEQGTQRAAEVQHNMGLLLAEEPYLDRLGFGSIEEQWNAAYAHFHKSVELKPDYVKAWNDFGILCKRMGRLDEAVRYYERAIDLSPDLIAAHYNLANVLAEQGKEAAAIERYRRVLGLEPGHLQTSINLAHLLERRREYVEAVDILRGAARRAPENDLVQYNLGWLLAAAPEASARDGQAAVALAMRLDSRAGGKNPRVLDLLAAGLAEVGQFREAERRARQASEQAAGQGLSELADQIRQRASLYQSGTPFRSAGR